MANMQTKKLLSVCWNFCLKEEKNFFFVILIWNNIKLMQYIFIRTIHKWAYILV